MPDIAVKEVVGIQGVGGGGFLEGEGKGNAVHRRIRRAAQAKVAESDREFCVRFHWSDFKGAFIQVVLAVENSTINAVGVEVLGSAVVGYAIPEIHLNR